MSDETMMHPEALRRLAQVMSGEFATVRTERENNVEPEWLQDERQYRGKLDPGIAAKIPDNRSRAVHRLTMSKVNTIKSRLMAAIFPANGQRGWNIKPTPYPEVHPVLFDQACAELLAQRASLAAQPGSLSMAERDRLKRELAEKARGLMETQMADHLAEGDMKYKEMAGKIILQGLKLGTGVLKGPLPERRRVMKYTPQITDSSRPNEVQWVKTPVQEREYYPHTEWVSVWSIYPDMGATDIRQAGYVWQTHLKKKQEVVDLLRTAGFRTSEGEDYLRRFPDGDASPYNYEQDLRALGNKEVPKAFSGRYRLLERWGYLSDQQLAQAGISIPDELRGSEVVCNLWLLGDTVIKVTLARLFQRRLPYYFFCPVDDDSTIFPESIPQIMRHPARIIDAALRMMLDNASMGAGPLVGLNRSALNEQYNPDPSNVYGGRVYLFEDVRDMKEAMAVWNVDSHIGELMRIIEFVSNFADETTSPRFMQGDGRVKGAGETASGLSMLMGAAQVNISDLVAGFDIQITEPFITALYDWEMRYNSRVDIKGDFAVVACGSTSLVAKEVRGQQLVQFSQATDNPRYAGRTRDDLLLREMAGSLDIDPDQFVLSDDAYRQKQQADLVMQVRAKLEAVMQVMEEKGIPAQQVLMQAMSGALQELQQAQSVGV